jgi:hypothetical protein
MRQSAKLQVISSLHELVFSRLESQYTFVDCRLSRWLDAPAQQPQVQLQDLKISTLTT